MLTTYLKRIKSISLGSTLKALQPTAIGMGTKFSNSGGTSSSLESGTTSKVISQPKPVTQPYRTGELGHLNLSISEGGIVGRGGLHAVQ